MRVHLSSLWVSIFIIFVVFNSLPNLAQPASTRYQKRTDRWEGIKSGYEVSGERLELTSLKIKSSGNLASQPQTITLGFVSPYSKSVSVTVRIPEINYWMEPIDRSGITLIHASKGLNNYSWSGQCLNNTHKKITDLHATAILQETMDLPIYCPVYIYANSDLQQTGLRPRIYEIVFVPNAEVTIKYRIQNSQGENLLSNELSEMPEGTPFAIPWLAEGMPDGIYKLIIDAEFPVRRKEPITQSYEIRFVHTQKIIQE